jgi:hypothetical protein
VWPADAKGASLLSRPNREIVLDALNSHAATIIGDYVDVYDYVPSARE